MVAVVGRVVDVSEFWGQLAGAALGVIVGYLASEALAILRRKGERKAVRLSVKAEIDQNQAEVRSINEKMKAKDFPADTFSQALRPEFSLLAWQAHLVQTPEAFSSDQARQIMEFYKALAEIVAVWDQYDEADRHDTQSQVIIRSQPTEHFSKSFPGVGTNIYRNTVDKLQPTLEKALKQAESFHVCLEQPFRIKATVAGWFNRK